MTIVYGRGFKRYLCVIKNRNPYENQFCSNQISPEHSEFVKAEFMLELIDNEIEVLEREASSFVK